MSVKEATQELATGQSDYVTQEEVLAMDAEQYRQYVLQAIAKGRAQIAAGLYYTQEEMEERYPEWPE
jgi:predicted transcriptional regulator